MTGEKIADRTECYRKMADEEMTIINKGKCACVDKETDRRQKADFMLVPCNSGIMTMSRE